MSGLFGPGGWKDSMEEREPRERLPLSVEEEEEKTLPLSGGGSLGASGPATNVPDRPEPFSAEEREDEEQPEVVRVLPDGRRVLRMTEKQRRESAPFWGRRAAEKAVQRDYENYREALAENPEAFARKLNIARTVDLPSHYLDDPEIFTAAAQAAGFAAARPIIDGLSPELRSWMAQHRLWALTHDDLENVKRTQDLLKYDAGTWTLTKGFRSGRAQTEMGALLSKEVFGTATEADRRRIEELRGEIERNSWGRYGLWGSMVHGAGELLGQRQDQIVRGLKWGGAVGTLAALTILTGGGGLLGAGALGSGTTAASLTGASFAGGMAYGAMESGFLSETGLAFDEFRNLRDEDGNLIDEDIARAAALVYGGGASAIEALQLDKVLAFAPNVRTMLTREGMKGLLRNRTAREAFVTLLKEYGKGLTFETATEVAQQGLQIAVREGAKAADELATGGEFARPSTGDVLGELWDTGTGALISFALPMLPGPLTGFANDYRAAVQAKENMEFFGALGDAAKASKLRERSPKDYGDMVAGLTAQGEIREMTLSASAWTEYFQSAGLDPEAAAAEAGLGETFREARESGGEMVIPTSVYAEKLAGTEHDAGLREDLRLGDAMTMREARDFRAQMKSDLERAASEAEAEYTRNEEEHSAFERVRMGLRAQLEALGHKKVGRREAEFYSTLWTAALANEARYAGMSIEEMARRPQWNVRFQFDKDGGLRPGRDVYTHPLNPDVDLSQVMPVIDISGKMEDAQRATPQSLLAFLREEFIGQEPDISADAQAMIGLSSGNKARHVVRSSQRGLSYEDVTQRTAGLLSLREILQNARLIESHDNQKTEKELVGRIHRFFVPVWTGGEQPRVIRISAQEKADSDGQVPLTLDLYDVIMENQNRPPRLSAASPESAPTERQLRRPVEITIADMLRGVKDAEGRPYVGEEYRQTSPRQSPDYDSSDPKTWPPSAERDEAIQLDAWTSFEPDGFIEDWPESTEKTEALALQKESDEIEAWIDSFPKEEILRRIYNDDPELDRKYSRVDEIDRHIKKLSRVLEKKKPKGAQRRLTQLIDAEEAAAARELGEEYYQRQAEAKLAQDEKAWAALLDRFLNNELTGNEKGAPLPVMTTPLVLSLTGVEVLPVEIHARNLDKILNGKHGIAPETLKQIPRAITDPIMIFRSPTDESKGRDSRVILTELTEKDADGKDRNIVAAITLERANTRHGYEINELTTVFRKDISSKQQLTPELDILDWMTRRHKDGSPMNLLLYLNRKKGLEWLDRTGTSPKASSPFQDPYVQSVPNEADLDKARTAAQGLYQDANSPLGYARFEEAETIVAILKDGNRSTFLHELGHVLLNSRLRLALMEGVDETVREDWTRLVEWLEVADIDFSKPLSEADEKRWKDAHEKFATGFEKYLMEGKAPSADLARAFRAFRKWLLDVYKAVRNIFYVDADGNRVGFEIDDEIRGVMDRMLATEEEIEASRAVREAERLAHILSEQGIPDDVAARYRDVIAEGADAAKAKLMKKLAAELKAEKQAELKEARRAAKKRAGAEVWALPEYRALKALRTPRAKGGLRLSVPALTELYGDAGAEALMKELPVGVLANDGFSPEAAAELLGYGTPEELLEDLKRAKTLPPQQAVADRARAATAHLESLIRDPEALRAEAERILHDRERLEWLALETEMLDEATRRAGKRIGDDARRQEREREKRRERARNKRAEEDLRGVFGPENLAAMAKAAEAEAKRILAGKRMRDISVSHYMAAEKRASAKALQAAAAARFDEARQWKRTELINHALAIEAMRVREEYEKGKKQLERYWPNRKRLRGAIGNEAFDQIIGLLERLGVNPEDPRAKGRPRLDEYLNTLAQKRETTPPVARWLRDLDIRDTRTSLAKLNPVQFGEVTEAIQALDKIGRLENTLLTAQRDETFAETVERLRAATAQKHGLPGPQSRATDQKGVGLFAGALASLDRVETLLRQADGLEEQGAFWEAIYLPAQRAYEAELMKGKAAKEAIEALFDKHFKDKKAFNRFLNEKLDTGMIDPGTEKKLYWSGENLLSAMLNWGNQHNRERLVYGNGLRENALNTRHAARPADDAQYYAEYEAGKAVAEAIFERLATDEMWDFCQDVWDYLDTFWPEIQALEERLNGAAPEKVEALPVRTASGKVLRGGYYPVRFDANADWMAFVHNEQETVKALYEDQTHRPGTRKGHTKERVDRIAPRQLLLSLDVIAEHTANVVHDLTHRETVRDLYKLIHDDTVRGLLTHAVGRAGFEQFSPWIQSLAAPSVPTDKCDRVFSKMMGNAAAVQLGLNMTSAVGQTVSLVPAAWKLGLRRVVPAVLNTLTLRGFWDSKYRDFAFALSPELADRINGTDRDIRAALSIERSGVREHVLSGAKAALYMALGWADMAVSLPVWHAAYEKGMARWNDQRKAADYANYVVRTTNNAGAVKDLAQVERGGPTRRLFTMYYSAFGSLYQMFREQMTRAGREGIPGKIKLAAFCFMMFTVQSALEDLVKGRAPLGDDEDDDSVGKWLLRGTFLSASSMFPIVRDVASGTTLLGGAGKFRPSSALEAGTAFIKAVDSSAKAVTDAWDGEDVEAERVVKNMVEAGGYAFGLPSVQLLRWYKTFVRWANDAPDWSPWELIWHKRRR